MRRFVLVLPLLILTAAAPGRPSDEAAIRSAEADWRQARIANDAAFLERFYAREARIQGMDGSVTSRDEDIAMFRTHQVRPELIEPSDMVVQVFGRTAVVTGVDHMRGSYRGHSGEVWLRFTDVLVHRDGRWQLVVQQTTPTATR